MAARMKSEAIAGCRPLRAVLHRVPEDEVQDRTGAHTAAGLLDQHPEGDKRRSGICRSHEGVGWDEGAEELDAVGASTNDETKPTARNPIWSMKRGAALEEVVGRGGQLVGTARRKENSTMAFA